MIERIEKYLPVPLESVPLGVPLEEPIFVRVGAHYILFRNKGDVLEAKRMESLRQKTDTIFVTEKGWQWYWNLIQRKESEKKSNSEKELDSVRVESLALGREIEMKRALGFPEVQKFQSFSDFIATTVFANRDKGRALLRKYSVPEFHFSSHMLNVAVYSALIGWKHNLKLDELKILTLSGMLHDIGKLRLPIELVNKGESLSAEEIRQKDDHTKLGAQMLEQLVRIPEVALVALQHHESIDGKGYPQRLRGDQIHLFSKIVAVADTFESLTSSRPYRSEPFSVEVALEMMRHMQLRFDPVVFVTEEVEAKAA